MSDVSAWVMVPRGVAGVVDKESTRYSMMHAVISPSGNGVYLSATNGRIATITQCVGESDGNYLVPEKVLSKKASIAKMNGKWEVEQKKGRTWETVLVPSLEPDNQRFPDLRAVFKTEPRSEVHVRLDAKLLLAIAEAINENSTHVTLMMDAEKPDEKPMHVLGENGVGVLMGLCHDKNVHPKSQYNGFVECWADRFNSHEITERYKKDDAK